MKNLLPSNKLLPIGYEVNYQININPKYVYSYIWIYQIFRSVLNDKLIIKNVNLCLPGCLKRWDDDDPGMDKTLMIPSRTFANMS